MDGDKDSLLLDGRFSFLIALRLIRDNYKAVLENYSTSLIGGDLIRFIRYGLFGLSVLSAPGMDELGFRFGPRQEPDRFTRPAYKSSFNPASWTWGVGLRAYFLNPISFILVLDRILVS